MPTLTSLTSYREAVLSGATGSQRAKILACLFDSAVPLSRQQIAQLTGIPLNAVCGRVNDLLGRSKVPEKQQQPLIKAAYEEKHPVSGGTREYLEPIWPQRLTRVEPLERSSRSSLEQASFMTALDAAPDRR